MNTTFQEDFVVGVVAIKCLLEITEASGVLNVTSGNIEKFQKGL